MAVLNKNNIKEARDSKYSYVNVPEWGDKDSKIKIKSLSFKDQIEIEKIHNQKDSSESEKVLDVVLLACVDEDNKSLFDSSDKNWLKSKSPKPIMKIFNAVMDMVGEDVDEKAKN